MKSWLQDKDIEVNSTHNERKVVFPDRFIRTLIIPSSGWGGGQQSKPSPGNLCFVTVF